MRWNTHRSYNRIQQHMTSMNSKQIRIAPLKRKMDLGVVLSEFQCRWIYGAHVYVSLPTFANFPIDTNLEDDTQYLLQALHLYQREVFRIVEQIFQEYQVHFQGSKLHAMVCQPFGNPKAIAIRAILLQQLLNEFVCTVFRQVFPRYKMITCASGADIGKTFATRNGRKKNRELLFVGSAANYAAKIMEGDGPYPRFTKHIYQLLPGYLKDRCERVKTNKRPNVGMYHLPPFDRELFQKLLCECKVSWKPGESRQMLTQAKQETALSNFRPGSVRRLIDLPTLSLRNNKRVLAASLFADISGYTKYIEEAENAHERKAALCALHVIRREMTSIIIEDFGGLHVQFQGDRVQGLFYIPHDNEQAIAIQAVQAAIGLQSSMEGPLKTCLNAKKALHLAIGIYIGETLVSRTGVRRHRDAICIGRAVENAAALEGACEGLQIAISRRVYTALPSKLCHLFTYCETKQCYIAVEVNL